MAWLSTSWTKRFPITHDATLVTSNLDVGRFGLSLASATFWANVKSDGGDIRITKADGTTQIPFEVVGFNSGAETGTVFFKDSVSSSSDTTWYVYYDNSGASALATNDTYGAENVWGSDYLGVWHMQETGGTTALDSTANSNDAASAGTMTSGDNVAGYDADAVGLDFDGTDDVLNTGMQNLGSTAGTVSWWQRPNTAYNDGVQQSSWGHRSSGTLNIFEFTKAVSNTIFCGFYITGTDDRTTTIGAAFKYPNGSWIKYDFTWGGGQARLFIDGVKVDTELTNTPRNIAQDFKIGGVGNSAFFANTAMGQFQIKNTERSEDVVASFYAMESDQASFWTEGADENAPPGGSPTYTGGFFALL